MLRGEPSGCRFASRRTGPSHDPLSDFDQRVADISVDHPAVVSNYRAAREIARRSASGEATTEELRQSLVYYRGLFEDLLESPEPVRKEARR